MRKAHYKMGLSHFYILKVHRKTFLRCSAAPRCNNDSLIVVTS